MYRACQPKVSHSDKPPPDSTFIIQRSDDGFWTAKVRARSSSKVADLLIGFQRLTSTIMFPAVVEAGSENTMHLVPPARGKKKWNLRFTIEGRKPVKVTGDEDRTVAIRIGNRIEMLIKAKQQGDPPPGELASWIDNMPSTLSARLLSLGLIQQRNVDRNKPLSEHIDAYQSNVSVRKSNKARQGKHQAGRVRIVVKALKATQFSDLTADGLLHYLAGRKIATATRRAYIIVMKDFGKEMVRLGGASVNPFAHLKPPGQYENPEYERQPLTVKQFRLLMNHLDTFTRYFQQKCRWTAHDRKMLYWTAVKTAYRQSELRALRKANFYLDDKPAVVSLKARHAKNKTEGEIAIPSDLAKALATYMADLQPNDHVFLLPTTSGSIVDTMRRPQGCRHPVEVADG